MTKNVVLEFFYEGDLPKHYGSLEKTNHKFIVDECASHVILFSIQALSLELAGELSFTNFE